MVTGGDDGVGVAMVEDGNGVGAYHLVECQLDGSEQVEFLFFLNELDELYEHFRVGVRHERDALGLKPASELGIVFDDAIVNDGEIFRL